MYYDKKWSDLSSAEKAEIKKAHGGAGTGAKSKWQQAKQKAQSHQAKPAQPAQGTNSQGYKTTSDENFDSSKLAKPEEVTGSKWKDENYYKNLGIQTKGAESQQRMAEEKAQVAQQPQSEAAQRVANNKAIIADRGSANRLAYERELKDLRQSTGYGAEGNNAQDIRAHLRQKIEDGYVVTGNNKYSGTSWMKAEGAKGNEAAMDRLKQIAYGDTPTTFTDLRMGTGSTNISDEEYIPMAERENVTWRDWTPGGGSDKEGYFKGMYDLNLKYGYTDKSYDDWNNSRIQANRETANRHKNNVNAQQAAGTIDKYGNPTPQY